MTLRRCPACRQSREAKDFLAGLCPACFAAGRPIPLGPLETAADESRRLRNVRKRRGTWTEAEAVPQSDTQQHGAPQEDAMTDKGERHECPWCHQPKANLYEHKKFCKRRPAPGTTAATTVHADPAFRKAATKPIRTPKQILKALDQATIAHNRDQATDGNGHDCAVCPLAGNHAEQDLFTQLVRGGLSLADAVARMAQARVVYAGTKGGA